MSPKKVDLIPKKVVFIPKKVDSIPETVDLHFSPCTLHPKNRAKIRFFLHISKKKCIFAGRIINCIENHVRRTIE